MAVRRMKSILAVRQRKINYRREAKKKLISPWGVNSHQAENRFLPLWGKEKLIFAVRGRKYWYRREAWIAVRRNEIDSCREAKKNWLSPWGEEKIDYRRETKKNWLSPWGIEKIDIAVRRRKIDIAAKKNRYRGEEKLISRRRKIRYRGKEKTDIASKKNWYRGKENIRCCWGFISNTGAPLKRRAKAETVSLRAIIYRNFSELWETEGVVKRSLCDIIKGTDRPILPSTEDWKYSKISPECKSRRI